jgi:hypothetical protein
VEKLSAYPSELVVAGALPAANALLRRDRMRVETIRACSGCAADYEDPDATAWAEDIGENDEPEEPAPAEEFSVRGNRATGREEKEMRRKKGKPSKRICTRSQREVLRDVMLSATGCGTWLTLRELSRLTSYGEASISAQLRHLRKPRYGAFVIDKQVRKYDEVNQIAEHGAVWEYRLRGVLLAQPRRDGLSEQLLRGLVPAPSPPPTC